MKRKKKRVGSGILICLVGILLAISGIKYATAERPRAVTLIYFRATGGDGFVALEWATATELDTAGFRVERAQSASGSFELLSDIGFIPAAGSGLFGATYSAEDQSQIINDQTYYYRLIEVELDGTQNRFGPISAVPSGGASAPTSTSTATSTSVSQNNQVATSTPTRTSTPTTTPTSRPTSSPTPSATATFKGNATVAAPRTPRTNLQESELNESDVSAGVASLEQTQNQQSLSSSGISSSDIQRTPNPGAVITDQGGYPAPPTSDAGLIGSDYPANPAAQMNSTGAESPNLDTTEFSSGLLNSDPGAGTGNQRGEDQADQSSNTLFLWVGFLAALLIFIAGILASIYYFDRERTRR